MSLSHFSRSMIIASSLVLVGLREAPPLIGAQARDGARPSSQSTPQPPSPAPPATAPAPPAPPAPPHGQPINIRIELLLTDSIEAKVIAEEKLNTVLADRQLGRVRRRNGPPAGFMMTPGQEQRVTNRIFEVDITPEIVDQKVKLTVTLNYMAPAGAAGEDEKTTVSFVENVSSFLESGKAMTIIEAKGDPVGNRRVVVQTTATILR
jgi:hypothetical protein